MAKKLKIKTDGTTVNTKVLTETNEEIADVERVEIYFNKNETMVLIHIKNPVIEPENTQ